MSGAGPTFVSVPVWRWRVWVHPPTWAVGVLALMGFTLLALLGIALAAACIGVASRYAPDPWGTGTWASVVAAVGALTAGAALGCRQIARWASQRTAAHFASVIPEREPARALMLAELRESGPPRDAWSGARATRWVEEIRRHSQARAFVGRSLEERVQRYDITDRPVEPERMAGAAGTGSFVLATVFAVVAAYQFWFVGARSILPYVFAGAVIMTVVRLMRRRALFAPIVSGQGWVEHGSARWTTEDSVIYVTGRSSAHVRVVGPPGVLTMSLATGRGKDFEALWTRWMHPAPDLRQRAFDA